MTYFKATIDVLIEADDEASACDAIAEALRPMLRPFAPDSAWIDWHYSETGWNYPAPYSGEGFEYAEIENVP